MKNLVTMILIFGIIIVIIVLVFDKQVTTTAVSNSTGATNGYLGTAIQAVLKAVTL